MANYQRGHPIARLVTAIVTQGYVRTALQVGDVRRSRQFSCSTVMDGEAFTRGRAPEHLRRIQRLIAVLAVALADRDPRFEATFRDDGHFSPDQRTRLVARFGQLKREQVDWAHEQLRQYEEPPAPAHLPMFDS